MCGKAVPFRRLFFLLRGYAANFRKDGGISAENDSETHGKAQPFRTSAGIARKIRIIHYQAEIFKRLYER